mmetsp:Transcript_21835/g.32393  ORF Transcript_21835/g.32393 Transcript_21835/m.32393 type:complete len:99 (-) Transcript_21835:534-830(-)
MLLLNNVESGKVGWCRYPYFPSQCPFLFPRLQALSRCATIGAVGDIPEFSSLQASSLSKKEKIGPDAGNGESQIYSKFSRFAVLLRSQLSTAPPQRQR